MTLRCLFAALLLLAAALCPPTRGQATDSIVISGRVQDGETGQPLPRTHVFIPESMTGTTTDSSGYFRLEDITPGPKRFYVSRVGYENQDILLQLNSGHTVSLTVDLETEVLEGPAVTVSAHRDVEWYERLRRFEHLFVGESPMADKCTLMNPEVLEFETKWWGKFEARADEPLVIENRALGYRLKYFLTEFEEQGDIVRWDGEPLFEKLIPRDSLELARWRHNRLIAYRGSLRHFLRALLADRVEEEQFDMYRLPRATAFQYVGRADRLPTSKEYILKPGPDSTHLLNVSAPLEIIYRGEPESEEYLEWADVSRHEPRSFQTSMVRLNERPIHIDRYGEIVEPYGATLYRYFAFTVRMAQLLPREYEPPE